MGASYSSTLREIKSVSGLDPALYRKAICNSLVIILNEASDAEPFSFFHGEGTGISFQQMGETLCFLEQAYRKLTPELLIGTLR